MKSRPSSQSPTKRVLLPSAVTFCVIAFGLVGLVHANKHAGIIQLRHAFADLVASASSSSSSSESHGKGISREHIELFKAHDRARHGRILASAAEFQLRGNSNPYEAGIYYTRVRLGTPPKEYFVQVDTGSDLLWLNCNPCTACPKSNNLGMILVPYDAHTSLTSSTLSCEDPICLSGAKVANTHCDEGTYCGYSFQYGDGSSTTGYLIEDVFMYRTVQQNTSQSIANAKVIFGCGYRQSGNLLTAQNVVDGIMGFGQSKLSIVSQLSMKGLTPRVFAHCLEGSEKGGGILVLGDIVDPELVFTPIISSQSHYNVNLKGISVNGILLVAEKSSPFSTTDGQGTIFDSGTTLAYITEPTYTDFITAIIKGAPLEASRVPQPGNICFVYSGSVDDAFPVVTLHFDGADMKLKGSNYLIKQLETENAQTWCSGWHSISSNAAVNDNSVSIILGDMVLKDKIIVYDLENQRIGWVDYDCSSKIPVSSMAGNNPSVLPDRVESRGSSSKTTVFFFSLLSLLMNILA